ncbi:MAG: polysaccharide biosynthesis tyrosine autokinase, partial [Gemmatimonadota bacterium]
GGAVRFEVSAPPSEQRVYELALVPAEEVVGEIRNNISAIARENTNIIDVTFTHPDPVLAPRILNQAAQALRQYGARRVSVAASQDVAFIEEQLDSARRQLSQSLEAIQEFKETRAFTDLSLQEQNLVNEIQRATEDVGALERQRSTLAELERRTDRSPLGEVNLVSLVAELPEGQTPQIRDLADRIQDRQEDLQDLLTTQRVTRDHPRAQALLSQIASIRSELGEAIRANLRAIEGRIETLNQELTELRDEQQQFPALENRLQTLQLQQNLDEGTYEFLLSQLYEARIVEAAAAPYVDVIDPALEGRPIQPRGQVNVVLGALLGLILGVGTAFFLEYLDRTIRTSNDIEALLGIPVLGLVPRLRRVEDREAEEKEGGTVPLIVALDPLDPAAEAYRNLRMNLTFMSTEDDPVRAILVTSPGPGEGKSTTALNLAVMLAQQGRKILLIDADLRRPALHRALDLLREPGLTDLLVGNATMKEAVRPNVLPNLDILPSGPFPPNPSELLDSKSMKRLIADLRDKYEQIVIDSPPMLAVTDTSVLSTRADGVLLVMRSGETEQRAAERSVDQLRRLDVRIFGAVLNEVSTSAAEDSYYLQYYYAYEPDRSGTGKAAVAGVREGSES